MTSSSRSNSFTAAIQDFGEKLNSFSSSQLMLLSQYFSQDLTYVTGKDIALMLQELTTRRVITPQDAQMYAQLEKKTDGMKTAKKIASDVLSKTKDAGLEFWKSLYSLKSNWAHPNLNRIVKELSCRGQDLLEEILLNKDGHLLDQELKDSQAKLKDILWERIKALNGRIHGAQMDRHGSRSCFVEAKMVSGIPFRGKEMPECHVLLAVGECYLHPNLQESQEWITRDQLFRWCLQSHSIPHTVMLSGAAGVGKTTLVQKCVSDWVTGKHYQQFAFVFFFQFRDLNALEETSLEVLLQREYPKLYSRLGTILQHPEKLLFIFDGLDESNKVLDLGHDRSPDLCVLPGDVKPVHVIVASLLTKTLLKGASVLLTSRPATLAKVEMQTFDRVATIVGFLARDREEYFWNFFGEMKIATRALAYVRDSQVLYALCSNPLYCWMICMALEAYFNSTPPQRHPPPQTVTQLLVSFMEQMMDYHGGGSFFGGGGDLHCPSVKELLVQLGCWAGRCLITHTMVFKEWSLKASLFTHPSLLRAFVVEDTQKRENTYSFIHLGVQEFFAALFHYLDFREEYFSDMMELVQEDRSGNYDMFLRFLAGLSHQKTRSPLEELLGSFSVAASARVIDWLKETNLKALLSAATASGKRKALRFFYLLFEAQQGHLVCQLTGDSARVDFSELCLLPVDCAILGYVLGCCPTVGLLNLSSCFIHNEGLQKLSPHLHVIQDLSLQDNCLTHPAANHLASALKSPQCQLESLSLARNLLTRKDCEVLSSALLGNRSLLNLDLSRTKLRNDGLSALLKAFESPACKIQKLTLEENTLTDASCKLLGLALARNTSLISLNLSGNPLTDESFPDLCDLIQHRSLKEIRLNFTDITPPTQDQLKILAGAQGGFRLYT